MGNIGFRKQLGGYMSFSLQQNFPRFIFGKTTSGFPLFCLTGQGAASIVNLIEESV